MTKAANVLNQPVKSLQSYTKALVVQVFRVSSFSRVLRFLVGIEHFDDRFSFFSLSALLVQQNLSRVKFSVFSESADRN
jgi:hypothetical protein